MGQVWVVFMKGGTWKALETVWQGGCFRYCFNLGLFVELRGMENESGLHLV